MPAHRLTRIVLALIPLTFFVSASPAQAETLIKVTTTVDDLVVNGNCTLREAVIAANTDAAVDACPAGSGADRIVLRAGTYALVIPLQVPYEGEDASLTGDLDILDSLTIRGAGSEVTVIDAGGRLDPPPDYVIGIDRVIDVVNPSAFVTLTDVAIQGGRSPGFEGGGGIRNRGTLTLNRSQVIGNAGTCVDSHGCVGGGIYNRGGAELSIYDSLIAHNRADGGGGIFNESGGTVRVQVDELGHVVAGQTRIVRNSTFSGGGGISNGGALSLYLTTVADNEGFEGAGILNGGTAQLHNSDIRANAAAWGGGGIVNQGTLALRDSAVAANSSGGQPGGGLVNRGTFDAVNVTLSGNGGGGAVNYGLAEFRHGTIAGNGTGLITEGQDASTTIAATVLADNGCSGAITSLGNNLDTDGSCGLNAPGDLPNTGPLLGPLADNGGPTPTHALLAGSPAIDHIPASHCSVLTDQRGVARPQPPKKSPCDIGAYEFSPAGDVALIMHDVQSLVGLTEEQVFALLDPLKLAYLDLVTGVPAHACEMLDVFVATVASDVSQGILTPDAAQPLLEGAHRVQAMVCTPG